MGRILNPERTAETSGSIVRLRAVVPDEDPTVAAITIESAVEFSDVSGRCNPARRLRIELAQLLQREILFLGQKLDTYRRGHIHDAVFGFMFFPGIQRF